MGIGQLKFASKRGRETLSFNPISPPIGDGRIVGSMAVYHFAIFCYYTSLERCNTLIPDALSEETAELR